MVGQGRVGQGRVGYGRVDRVSTYVQVRSWPRGLPGAEIRVPSSDASFTATTPHHLLKTKCSMRTECRDEHQHSDQQFRRQGKSERFSRGGKVRHRLAGTLRAEG